MGFQPIRSAGCRCHVRRYEDFGRLQLHRCLFPNSDIFKARQFAVRWSINTARICFPEIGGMKNRGPAKNGICNWRLENWFSLMKVKELGSWMGCMTSRSLSFRAKSKNPGIKLRFSQDDTP